MPHIERTAAVVWEGNVARGGGSISAVTSGAFAELAFSLPTRIGKAEGKTSPEELLAAAHGGCITMSLASELTSAGTPPGRLDVTCTVVMDEVEGQGHQIVGSRVEAVVAVAGLDEAALRSAVEKADESCPFSQLLKRAGADVQITARLA
jgi:osmotically inducible protein OsmC